MCRTLNSFRFHKSNPVKNLKVFCYITFLFFIFSAQLVAQVKLSGNVSDKTEALQAATKKVMNTDSSFVKGTKVKMDGIFFFQPPKNKNLSFYFLTWVTSTTFAMWKQNPQRLI